MTTKPYKVAEVHGTDDHPVVCEVCGWVGTGAEVADVVKCALGAGDPSPIGRCPMCSMLVYPEVDKDKAGGRPALLFRELLEAHESFEGLDGLSLRLAFYAVGALTLNPHGPMLTLTDSLERKAARELLDDLPSADLWWALVNHR